MDTTTKPNVYLAMPPAVTWQGIGELAGHNIETRGREAVNKMLKDGWVLLLVYVLRYEENNLVRERPMAILGKPRQANI